MPRHAWTRRAFLRTAASGAVSGFAAAVIPAAALGRSRLAAPSQRITVGLIGAGRQLFYKNWPQFSKMRDVQVVAVCDVDAWRLAQVHAAIEKHYAAQGSVGTHSGCRAHRDYREVLDRPDIDAVMISTPDHWHVPLAIEAARAGKDVSLEKPITRTIAEGQRLIRAMRDAQRVFRVDSEFRSAENFHRMAELVHNGRIGQIKSIRVGVPAGDNVDGPPTPDMPVPEELDYERWQGPAPRAAYTVLRVHPRHEFGRPGWMRVLDYCDGMITNWGAHLCDIAQWCHGTERTGPVEITGEGVWPPPGKLWNVLKTFRVTYRFADGTTQEYETSKPYVRIDGTEGWIYGEFGKGLDAEPKSILTSQIQDGEIRFPLKSDKQDFIDAVKTRGRTLEDEEVGHRTTSLCHLGHIAIRLGQPLKFDPQQERFVDHDEANAYLDKPMPARTA
ncbi:MAG: Gfo/Idh/MocA family oxidoreductase [Candidatus Anammoximicrobium sp.]|nr:Gfo/Idh/MocA family oxidoreductase [Candidatus Anammoximicrobium sp.]